MPRANWDFIGSLPIPHPPLSKQRRIADYLDRETARIDELVAAKESMLGLLEEKRATLISRAVTGNLECADMSALSVRGDMSPRSKAASCRRTPKA